MIEVWPAYEEFALRIELFGDEVDALAIINPTHRRDARGDSTSCTSTRPSTSSRRRSASSEAVEGIGKELEERLEVFRSEGKLLEAQRLAARTRFDMEMLLEVGHCPGIENYARWFSGRKPGEPPYTLHRLLPRRFPDDRGRIARHAAAGARHVRRRPQPQDARWSSTASACPARWTIGRSGSTSGRSASSRCCSCRRRRGRTSWSSCGGEVVEQVIRPTGLVDPLIHVKPARGQVPDLVEEIKKRAGRQGARAGDDADQAAGGGPERLLPRGGPALQVAALGTGRHRARAGAARAARGGVRRAGRRQPAARRARPAGGVAGRHPRRRQGRLSAAAKRR